MDERVGAYRKYEVGDKIRTYHVGQARGPDGTIIRITPTGQMVLDDGRRFMPDGIGIGHGWCLAGVIEKADSEDGSNEDNPE